MGFTDDCVCLGCASQVVCHIFGVDSGSLVAIFAIAACHKALGEQSQWQINVVEGSQWHGKAHTGHSVAWVGQRAK